MSLMMPRLRALAALPLVAALSLTAACDIALSGAREEATETVTRSFPLSPGGTLDIATTNGRIEVVAGSGPTVEVKAVKVAKAATKEGAADLLKKLQIKEEVTADLVKLRAERRAAHADRLGHLDRDSLLREGARQHEGGPGHDQRRDRSGERHRLGADGNGQRPDQRARPRRRRQGLDHQRRRRHRAGGGDRRRDTSRPRTAASRCACRRTPRRSCSVAPPTAA